MEPKKSLDPEIAKHLVMGAAMRDLIQSPGWDSYRKLLEDAENGLLKRLLDENRETYDYNKGFIMGLRLAFNIPQQIIDRASQL